MGGQPRLHSLGLMDLLVIDNHGDSGGPLDWIAGLQAPEPGSEARGGWAWPQAVGQRSRGQCQRPGEVVLLILVRGYDGQLGPRGASRQSRLGATGGSPGRPPRPWPRSTGAARTPSGGAPSGSPVGDCRRWPRGWRASTPADLEGSQRHIGSAETVIPRLAGYVSASAARRVRHQP